MLGGSFWVAFWRNSLGAILLMGVFLLLDKPRFAMRKTVWYYVIFGFSMVVVFSAWYLFDRNGFIQCSGLLSPLVIGLFCGAMSGGTLYLSLYKISLGFYFLSLCVFGGVDIARWWFEGNMWVDILIRLGMVVLIFLFIVKKFRRAFLDSVDFLREEMDLFSAGVLVISIMLAAVVIYWPDIHNFSVINIVRISVIMLMAGVIQYTIFHLYLHLGREHKYQEENQLLEMNEQLLRRQMDLEREKEREAARMFHDVRHHCLLLAEYMQNGELEELASYVKQYGKEVEKKQAERAPVCGNKAVDRILSVYARCAELEKIRVTMDVTVEEALAMRDIDLVAILANVFENAIHGCQNSGKERQEIDIYITQKGNKIVIRFRNTCISDIRFRNGFPESGEGGGIGISSIVKTVERYDGEVDFSVKNDMFVTRILLNLSINAWGGVKISRRGKI